MAMSSGPRRNLILSSGGGLGAWQAGALHALVDADPCAYQCVAGVSVGALNAALLCELPVGRTREAVERMALLWPDGRGRGLPSRWRIMLVVACCGPCASSALDESWLERMVDWVDGLAGGGAQRPHLVRGRVRRGEGPLRVSHQRAGVPGVRSQAHAGRAAPARHGLHERASPLPGRLHR